MQVIDVKYKTINFTLVAEMGEFDQNKSKYIEEHINNNNFINCNWRGVDGNECVQR